MSLHIQRNGFGKLAKFALAGVISAAGIYSFLIPEMERGRRMADPNYARAVKLEGKLREKIPVIELLSDHERLRDYRVIKNEYDRLIAIPEVRSAREDHQKNGGKMSLYRIGGFLANALTGLLLIPRKKKED